MGSDDLKMDRSGRTLKEYRELYWEERDQRRELQRRINTLMEYYAKWEELSAHFEQLKQLMAEM